MFLFTIFHVDGRKVGCEFGQSASHALERYAAGSIYPIAELRAVQGLKG